VCRRVLRGGEGHRSRRGAPYGWGCPPGPAPVGCSGLVRLDSHGDVKFADDAEIARACGRQGIGAHADPSRSKPRCRLSACHVPGM
jgi:hypothetical protein